MGKCPGNGRGHSCLYVSLSCQTEQGLSLVIGVSSAPRWGPGPWTGASQMGRALLLPLPLGGRTAGAFVQSTLPPPACFPRKGPFTAHKRGEKEEPAGAEGRGNPHTWATPTSAHIHTALSSPHNPELIAGAHGCPLLPTTPESQPCHTLCCGHVGSPGVVARRGPEQVEIDLTELISTCWAQQQCPELFSLKRAHQKLNDL